MEIEYKILNNGTGIIITRQPEVANELILNFVDAPSGATAIISSGENSVYRLLEDNKCEVPIFEGVIKVTVAILDGSSRPRKWVCEELVGKKQNNGEILIQPNDNLPQKFVELKLENEELRNSNKSIEKRLKTLEDKLESIFDGYDLI